MRTQSAAKRVNSKTLRPLHLPSPVRVRTNARGRPVAVGPATGSAGRSTTGTTARPTVGSVRGSTTRSVTKSPGMERVVQIREIWRIDDEWWREPISRLYFEVILEDGERTILYRDLTEERWYRQ